MSQNQMLERAMPWLVVLCSLVAWEAGCNLFAVPKFILPSPSQIAASIWQWHEQIGLHAAQTLYTTIVGFAFAVAGGMLLGIAIGASRLFYKGLYPILIGFNSVPKVAVVPVLVIWFGIGSVPAIITAFLLAFFPIVVNVATGLATIEPELEDVLRSLGASKWDILIKIGIPGSLPYFFASLKIAITMALVGSVVSESIASNTGIGYLMLSASSQVNVPLAFAGLVVVAVMGVLIYAVFAVIEHRFTYWATRRFDYAAGS